MGALVAKKTTEWSDGELVPRLQQGDEDAFRYFYDKYCHQLYNYVYHRVGHNRTAAEEIVGESMLSAVKHIPNLNPERSNLYIWLLTVARNKITDHFRRQKPAVSIDECLRSADQQMIKLFSDVSADDPMDDAALESEEVKLFVNAAMSSLPDKYRESLTQKYVENKSVDEMAVAWNSSPKAVESMLYRSRNAFKQAFEILLKERLHPATEKET